MNRIDREALTRAIALAREEDAARKQQIDDKLKGEAWEAVAMFASYCCQNRALRLKPWQSPPMCANVDDQDDSMGPRGGRRSAALLLQRLLDAGLSRYEPDPLGTLERAEAERAKAS